MLNDRGGRAIGVYIARIVDDEFIPTGTLTAGDEIISINGQTVRDGLDVIFYSADEELDIEIRRVDGSEITVNIDKPIDRQLGVELVPDRIRVCKADCDFCFVKQQPKKRMRRALYIKDDDYRLSFLHGNFITLTNVTADDYERIFEQCLSPLYISVHATDDAVRRRHLSAPQARPIMDDLRLLIDRGIMVHTQIVVVPGLNDGAVLDRTLHDLAELHPDILSIGVVPVGLTKYREGLPEVRLNTAAEGRRSLEQIERMRESCSARFDDPVVYAADELFILAAQPIPPAEYYGDYPQLENGIGLLRRFMDTFEEERDRLPSSLPARRKVTLLTGRSAGPYLRELAARISAAVKNLEVAVESITSGFWGETVTVSGLLTGEDIVAGLRKAGLTDCDVVLPPDCLNSDELFLDDKTPPVVAEETGCRVHQSTYSLVETLLSIV